MNTKINCSAEMVLTRILPKTAWGYDQASGQSRHRMSGNHMIIFEEKSVAKKLVTFAVRDPRKEGLEVAPECYYPNRFSIGCGRISGQKSSHSASDRAELPQGRACRHGISEIDESLSQGKTSLAPIDRP
jgi:hypothetical protein